ncbi:metal-dependent hydrolase [Phaeospirillum tilakii]|uniref:Metal-dependent hydrolase n=1 Tax=Phaeospirillum tilakii TaxID=741673 RepID=A0ABW5C6D8_9PROT
MKALAHMAAGLASVSVAVVIGKHTGHPFDPAGLPLYYAVGVGAALLPDFDHCGSTIGSGLKTVMLLLSLGMIGAIVVMGPALPLARLTVPLAVLAYYAAAMLGGHRSPWTHSLWPLLGGTVATIVLASWLRTGQLWVDGALDLGIAFAAGYGSHLLLDSCTRYGVPLLWPWVSRNVGPRLVTTGGPAETVAVTLSLVVAAAPLVL